ncbi:MerR family transcriptional regulator [Sphingomonas melonis TY]|uniref:MerR family transcriptional regulator n=1 Tax=Sphingomonas melonis TY TaxID=621456 RepID=A0A154NBP0_9SPHN|nr:MerR family DNA-binding transcriptional regulator [Sphingomonas melonis]AOW23499.1 MerR family transcriptional regulator [Sphingomonas melonis TY]KZB97128.1 MerR family transcriptional regulator [Sphingomonas melonis TY]
MNEDRGELQGIQEVAEMLGITPRTLRFYEDKGLIEPCRIGTTRVYRRREIARMQLILRGKRLGFSLTDIAEFLDLYDADPQHLEQMRALAERVRMRIKELEKQRDALDQTLGELAKLEGEALARVHAHEPEAQRAAG